MKNDLQAGLQNIIDAINNLIEPKLGSLRYDKTFRTKVISDEGNNVYGVQINGKNYKAVYTGEKIPVGQIVKVKAPLNNFSDIYIETLPGSGSGSAGNYNDLLNKPILNTNNTGTQVPSATETIQGTISLHKVSKTGNYNDLLNKPTLDFIPTSEKGAANGVAGLDENKKVSKSNLPTDTVYDNNYVHTDNNFTTAMKNKLDSVEEGAEPNKIEIIQRNGSVLPINNKIVNVEVPTKTSDLTNDSGFINSIPIASDTILGGIKVGDNLSITADGVLSAEAGGTTDYSVLLNKPVLNTENTKSLAVDSNETINGVVSLHNISKTGSYEDLLNKPTIPTKTSDLENDSGFITNTVDNLTNYYLKSETYTQSEVNNLIGQIKTISIEVVNTLPTTGEDNKIYLVPKEGSTGDVYNEYIWVNNTWELIGSTQVDLTGYATQDWVNNQIKDFLNESQVTQIVNNSLTNYYTKTETYSKTKVNNLLNGKANADDIPTKTGDLTNNGDGTTGSKYITNSDLNTELDTKVDKTTTIAGIDLQNNITVGELVDALKIKMLKIENPVGHIRMETKNINPATYLGFGTWVLWGSGKVPVGVNTSDSSFNTVEKTGGSKTANISHTHTIASHNHGGQTGIHTLTINEIPSHTHNAWQVSSNTTQSSPANALPSATTWTNKLWNVENFAKSTGGGKGHTHTISASGQQTTNSAGSTSLSLLQPYITCYMWKRTA